MPRRKKKGPPWWGGPLQCYEYCLAAGTRQVLGQDVRAGGRRARGGADPLGDRRARAGGAVAARHVRELVLAGAQLGLQAAFGDDLHFTRGGDLRRVAVGGAGVGATSLRLIRGHHTFGLVVLGDGRLADAGGVDQFGHFGTNRVVLVRRDGDGGQDADDRDDDHKFDQRKALLFFHRQKLLGYLEGAAATRFV